MSEKWTIGAILKWTKQYFESKGVPSARLDAEVLLSHILGMDRLHLYVNFEQPLQPEELASYREAVKQRAQRIPVAYITGYKEFMGLNFIVNPAVLIPRPDTEILVETVLARLQHKPCANILDIGTGSGAIIGSLLSKLPEAQGTAVDISPDALAVAAKNATNLGISERLMLFKGDLLNPVNGKCFDAIISNPPYLTPADMDELSPEVAYEPRQALAGGEDGLAFYRRLISDAAAFLTDDGFLAVEVGAGQAGKVAELAEAACGLYPAGICKDYAGIERVVVMERR